MLSASLHKVIPTKINACNLFGYRCRVNTGIDDLLYQPGFVGVEKWGVINSGGCCGAVPGHPIIGEILEARFRVPFEREDGSLNLESSGYYESKPLLSRGFKPNNTVQVIGGMTVYSSDFFHPFDYMSKELALQIIHTGFIILQEAGYKAEILFLSMGRGVLFCPGLFHEE